VSRPEVGAVSAEGVDPLLPRFVDGLGDEVGGVAPAATRHGDVRRRRACRVGERDMGTINGVALGAVHRGRVGTLDELRGVLSWDPPFSTSASKRETAVVADRGDGPGLAVGDLEVRVIPARGDAIAKAKLLAAGGRDDLLALHAISPLIADRRVQIRDLLPTIGDDELTGGANLRQCSRPLDI
jgi:hypothetical protein